MARDLHRQLNFWVDVNAVKDTLLEGKLTGELHDVTCEDETFTNIAGKRLADVFKHRRHHEVVRLVRAEVQLEDVAVLPNLDVPSGHT